MKFLLNDCFDIIRDRSRPLIVAARLDDASLPPTLPLLSAEENHRSLRFRFPEDRKSYVTAHVLKRLLLQHATRLPMSALHFRATPAGKPFLAGSDLDFSLSHTRGLVAVALSWCSPIGVDAETLASALEPGAELLDLGILSSAELDSVTRSNDPSRTFLRLWTAKEAVSKAAGLGLSMPFAEIAIDGHSARAGNEIWRLQFEDPSAAHLITTASADTTAEAVFRCIEEKDIWRHLQGG
ncbi:4'-phosphopantetheinyl transferase family protein [Thauera aromatica]|uniref:4'-phosphopantetheinyl transferase family protein n=1 Tax=Thauera aromatica TaxID=59405 RepID=UPI001FFDBE97|nr:4'-phosphopantetheinyl transferase superfamily protein [Thauera aromatica]